MERSRLVVMRLLFALLATFAATTIAVAQTGTYNADTPADPATEARLKHLSDELRCLVCQNQTIADSNADLAVDLRRVVRAQILAGKSDGEIKDYLVARYGDFVLYRPPIQANTALLWGGPFVLLAIGLIVWWIVGRRRPRGEPGGSGDLRGGGGGGGMSDDDAKRARALLNAEL